MSKMSKVLVVKKKMENHRKDETVVNFMGGESFTLNPLETLKMISASSIFGEASYYRNGKIGDRIIDARYRTNPLVKESCMLPDMYEGKTTTEIFEQAIDAALDYDFMETLNWAVTLRKDFYMRLNPQVILVRASIHPKRKEFTAIYPGMFQKIQKQVMKRADEPMTQLTYYLWLKGDKKEMPSILKRSIAAKLGGLNRYSVAKYKNHEIGMIDAVRMTHATSTVIDELMTNGQVTVEEDKKTWENLRSEGMSWKEICNKIDLMHMARLRNLRNVFTEVNDIKFCKDYLEKLKQGVLEGKQFPFRYYNAMKMIKQSGCNHKSMILTALEECMDIALDNMPKLSGRTMCLSDNSGSAWGTIPSEYGTVRVAEIDNLSSVIAAANSEDGYVGKFGDRLSVFPIVKRRGILKQAEAISKERYNDVGGSTEGGIWEFLQKAIQKKEWYDHIFIFSDQQAGHGGLYGTSTQRVEYKNMGFECRGGYINVFDLVLEYRKKVNPKVNVFSIQTAGYDNVVVPENAYRTSILYGWTGKELLYADAINKMWDEIDAGHVADKRMKKIQ